MIEKQPLHEFVAWWRQYCKGDEKGEAQIFLDRLFKAFGHVGAMEAGGIFENRVQRQRESKITTAFADFVIPGKVLIEMKKRGEDLRRHYAQAFEYWLYLVPNRPTYVILCNFDEFWIYDLNRQLDDPLDKVRVEDLPERWGPLAFLFPGTRRPTFGNDLVEVTKEAAFNLSRVFKSLLKPVADRSLERHEAQRFILQCMLALFAEDIGLLPRYTFTQVIEDCQNGQSSYDLMTLLFTVMNRPGKERAGRFYGVDYFDGGLFAKINPVELTQEELRLLREAAQSDWAKIRPAIFGTIFEDSMDKDERHEIGAHYTSEAEIQHIIQPVIVRPWRERMEVASSIQELRVLQDKLRHYLVLDPACGSGNFLYIAYREMKRLEWEISGRIQQMDGSSQQEMSFVNSRQFFGFDISPFAVELAKVTLMIAKKFAVDEFGLSEHPLPLDNLDANIRVADALFEPWPEFDACIGNPPYLGAKRLKVERGIEYVNKVRDTFPDVPGNADYCVYWFRKTHEVMKEGALAGLVGTNTIRQNYSRIGGLDYIVANGGRIFEAVSSTPWSGEAAVSVSIACWSKGEPPFKPPRLWVNGGKDVIEAPLISSSLSVKTDVSGAKTLSVNADPKRVFQGQTPGHKGFVLTPQEALELIRADLFNSEVIFPYLTGDDLVGELEGKPSRYIIDFAGRSLNEARNYDAPYKRLDKLVFPDFEAKAQAEITRNIIAVRNNPNAKINRDHQSALSQWWLHFRNRLDRKEAMQELKRCIACSRISKRPIFDFISMKIVPSDKVQTFAFDDDYSYGILQSKLHWEWWLAKGATLTDRPAYTPHSVFDTFPWPQNPKPKQVKAIADAARNLHEYRRQTMAGSRELTLREMYRLMEMPGKNPLKDLHAALDKAVMAAYGFDPKGDVLAQLLALNETVAARIEAGESVTAPGIPPDYPNPAELVSEGCITPPVLI